MRKAGIFVLICLISMGVLGCRNEIYAKYQNVEDITIKDAQTPHLVVPDINQLDAKATVLSHVITDKKIMALTIQGMGNEDSLKRLLNELDEYNIQATFFVKGLEVVENPELARLIVSRGHELANHTLTNQDLTQVNFETKIREIQKSRELIKLHTGVDAAVLRTGQGKVNEEVALAAAACGYNYITTYSIVPQSAKGNSIDQCVELVIERKRRGDIILLNLDKYEETYKIIGPMVKKLNSKGFKLVPISKIIEIKKEWDKNKYELPDKWYEVEYEPYNIVKSGDPKKKEIALTFDDWCTDDTMDEILDILDEYNLKATFCLRANGVELNPSLAYTIEQRGHEIFSHTYAHVSLTGMATEEIKQDLIKAHETITYAINREPIKYLRPPRGEMNKEVAKVAAEIGYKDIIMYDVTVHDYLVEMTAEQIIEAVNDKTVNGSIILLHILDEINTPEALPKVIETLRERGFTFITIEEMLTQN